MNITVFTMFISSNNEKPVFVQVRTRYTLARLRCCGYYHHVDDVTHLIFDVLCAFDAVFS